MIILYYLILLAFSLYSYTLVDPNITLINTSAWTAFRNYMVYWGYYRREVTSVVYIVLIVLMFIMHFIFLKKYKQFNPFKVAIGVGLIALIAYPFLSHDFFNYLFDAKILTYYHQNPYTHTALDFPHDQWTRFMHWTHRTYPYGPVFLAITLIPSFLSMGKFILSYALFKVLFIGSYGASVYYLQKLNKRSAMVLATHPFVIVEGLVNSHNDMIGLALGVIGVYFLFQHKQITSRVFFLLSAGIKYITAPVIFLTKKNKKVQMIVGVLLLGLLAYLSFFSEIQPWYFLAVFIVLPFYDSIIERSWIWFAGLLASYYPYIRIGGWGEQVAVEQKHQIIIVFGVVAALSVLYMQVKDSFRSPRSQGHSG